MSSIPESPLAEYFTQIPEKGPLELPQVNGIVGPVMSVISDQLRNLLAIEQPSSLDLLKRQQGLTISQTGFWPAKIIQVQLNQGDINYLFTLEEPIQSGLSQLRLTKMKDGELNRDNILSRRGKEDPHIIHFLQRRILLHGEERMYYPYVLCELADGEIVYMPRHSRQFINQLMRYCSGIMDLFNLPIE